MHDKIIAAVKEALEIEDRDIQLSDEFRHYDEWDSLGRLSLIAVLDDEFGVQIENNDFEKLNTVEDLLEAVKNKSSQ